MKVFTVYQPYAFAIVAGLKHYETRPRRTNIRGRVAAHAAIGGPDYISVALDSILPESMELHYGAVVGTVEIVDCVPVENLVDSLDDRERLLGDYSPGRFAWVLENPVMFDEPFPARGKQGWWNWDQRAAEMSRQIKREITRAATDLLYTPHTEDGISAVNSAVSEIVKQYCDSGEIAHGPTTDDISLGGAPLEVLPFLPFAIQTISGYGTYSVYRGSELAGTVTYSGPPVQETPGEGIIGIKTNFTPAEKMKSNQFTFAFNSGKDGENT